MGKVGRKGNWICGISGNSANPMKCHPHVTCTKTYPCRHAIVHRQKIHCEGEVGGSGYWGGSSYQYETVYKHQYTTYSDLWQPVWILRKGNSRLMLGEIFKSWGSVRERKLCSEKELCWQTKRVKFKGFKIILFIFLYSSEAHIRAR